MHTNQLVHKSIPLFKVQLSPKELYLYYLARHVKYI